MLLLENEKLMAEFGKPVGISEERLIVLGEKLRGRR